MQKEIKNQNKVICLIERLPLALSAAEMSPSQTSCHEESRNVFSFTRTFQ